MRGRRGLERQDRALVGDRKLVRERRVSFGDGANDRRSDRRGRLAAEREFQRALGAQFERWDTIGFHMAPPLLARRGPDGRPRKMRLGAWLMPAMRVLAAARAEGVPRASRRPRRGRSAHPGPAGARLGPRPVPGIASLKSRTSSRR